MPNDPYNERFQELARDIFDTIRALEFEIVVYRSAHERLKTSFIGNPSPAAFFQDALEVGRLSQKIRKNLKDTARKRYAPFQQMPNVPIDPKMDALRVFLAQFREGNPDLFPSDIISKDAL